MLIMEKLIDKWFEKYDLQTLTLFIESFVYGIPTKNSDTSKLIDKFLKEQDILEAYLNVIQDEKKENTVIFYRSSLSQRETIQNVKIMLLSIYFRRSLSEIRKLKLDKFFAKNTAIQLLTSLNNDEIYFNGKDEDYNTLNKLYTL